MTTVAVDYYELVREHALRMQIIKETDLSAPMKHQARHIERKRYRDEIAKLDASLDASLDKA